jgi:hypothetical protein
MGRVWIFVDADEDIVAYYCSVSGVREGTGRFGLWSSVSGISYSSSGGHGKLYIGAC